MDGWTGRRTGRDRMEWMGRIGRDETRRDETSDINGVVCDKVDRQADGPDGWADRWVD